MDEEKSIFNNGNTNKSCVMLLILNLLGGCKSQNLHLSCCKFSIYTHQLNSKFYNMTVDIHVNRSENLILNGSRSTDVKTIYQQQQQQQTNNLNALAFLNSQ